MAAFLLYQIKVAACITIFTGVYYLWLRRETFHLFNRFYLLASLLLSFILPFVKITQLNSELPVFSSGFIEAITVYADETAVNMGSAIKIDNPVQFIYLCVSSLVAIYLLIHIVNNALDFRSLRAKVLK